MFMHGYNIELWQYELCGICLETNMNHRPKALFFDIDGTLIDGMHGVRIIPASVVAQLERLHDAGHKLVVCSGRPYAMIGPELRLPVFDAYVMCNGAHVEADGRTIFTDTMGPELASHYADLFEELGMEYMLQTAHHIYMDRSYRTIRDFFASFDSPNIFTFSFDRNEVLQRTVKLEAHATEETYQLMLDHMKDDSAFTAHMDGNGAYNAFEIYSPTISKAVGIHKVLGWYGVRVEDSYGFGDGINDLEMIELVGCGVAMGNACDELKAAADVVCGTVLEDGLAKFLASIPA